MANASVVIADEVAPLHVVGEEVRPLVREAAFEVFDVRGGHESGPPPHTHPWDEAYVILEGQLMVQRGEESVTLEPGQSIHIPAMTLHRYSVISDRARFLTITSPAEASRFFADVDASVASPDDIPALVAAAGRHQVTSPLFPSA